uniref:DOP1-like TPR domain-containing protein n=1 Tax=Romanomermis culicivorax TaxID=13658 RepID=A0A915J9K4_ROMCU
MLDRPINPNDVESNLCLKIASIDISIDIFRSINLKISQQQRQQQAKCCTTTKSVKCALKKCKIQKTILRCLRSTLRNSEKNDDYASRNINGNLHPQPNLALRTLQHSLLQILEKILEFEFVTKYLMDEDQQNRSINSTPINQAAERCLIYEQDMILEDNLLEECIEDGDEEEDYSTIQSKLFRSIIDNCLQSRNFYSHGIFLKFLYDILPYAQDFLPYLVQSACKRIRYNLELCFSQRIQNSNDPFPPDYGIDLLKYLCLIGHFCLTVDLNASAATPIDATSTNQFRAMSSFSNTSATSASFSLNQNRPNNFLNTASSVILNPSDIFTNVFKAFNLTESSANRSPNKKDESFLMNQHSFIMARQQIFAHLSELLSTLCDIRSFLKTSQEINTLGKHENFYNIDCKQDDVAEFVLSIECLSAEKIFDGASKILQHPLKSVSSIDKDTVPFELSLCELVYACSKVLQQNSLSKNNNKQKAITWSILQRFLQESLQSCQAPMSKLNLFKLFCDFVEEEKDEDNNSRKINYRKELQELCIQFLDCLLEIVSFQLAQPTWLKRTLILKETDHTSMMSSSSSFNELAAEIYDDKISASGSSAVAGAVTNSLSASLSVLTTQAEAPAGGVVSGSSKRDVLSSVCALNLMADRLPNLVDSIFKSDDKDKLQLLAEKLWSNGVYPFLKSHSRKNAQNFGACSRLLAKLSQFPLIRNIWRKSAIDLLCDQQFFFIDNTYQATSIESWLIIVDNLMSQDRNSFREFLCQLAHRIKILQANPYFNEPELKYL